MKKVVKLNILLVFMLIISVILYLSGCQQKSDMSEKTIKDFETAFNNYDINVMLDCLHPSYRQSASDLMDLLTDKKWDASLIFNLAKIGIPLLPLLTDLNVMPGDLPKLSLTVENTDIDGDTAECKVACVLTLGKSSTDFESNVILEKIDDKWYIVKAK